MLSLDHIVITTRRLDDALAAWERLGFDLTERGRHPYGTANNLVMLSSTYIELISLVDPDAWDRAMEAKMLSEDGSAVTKSALDTRDGPSLWAVTGEDVEPDFARMRAAGVQVRDPDNFKRPVELPDGRKTAADITINYLGYPEGTPGVPIFVCRLGDRSAVWVPEWQVHPNTASEVVGITYSAERPGDLIPYLSAVLGSFTTEDGGETLTFTAGPVSVVVTTPARCAARFGAVAPEDFPSGPSLEAVTVAVRDLSAARSVLEESGVAYETPADGLVQIGREQTLGTILEFVQEG